MRQGEREREREKKREIGEKVQEVRGLTDI